MVESKCKKPADLAVRRSPKFLLRARHRTVPGTESAVSYSNDARAVRCRRSAVSHRRVARHRAASRQRTCPSFASWGERGRVRATQSACADAACVVFDRHGRVSTMASISPNQHNDRDFDAPGTAGSECGQPYQERRANEVAVNVVVVITQSRLDAFGFERAASGCARAPILRSALVRFVLES